MHKTSGIGNGVGSGIIVVPINSISVSTYERVKLDNEVRVNDRKQEQSKIAQLSQEVLPRQVQGSLCRFGVYFRSDPYALRIPKNLTLFLPPRSS